MLAANYDWDTKIPLNVEDTDLDPDMKELPKEREGATEMMFCLMRYQLGSFFKSLRQIDPVKSDDPNAGWKQLTNPSVSLAEKDRALEDIQKRFEANYLGYCDPLVPLHFMVSVVSRSILCMLYMIIHHPRNYQDGGASMTQKQKDTVFEKALKIVEYGNLLKSSPATKGFLWHINVFFTWQAFIFLLDHLVNAPLGIHTDKAWEQLELVYEHHPALITDKSNKLHAAVRRLTIRAWDGREKQFQKQGRLPPERPEIINILKRNAARRKMPPLDKFTHPGPQGILALEGMAQSAPESQFTSPSTSSGVTQDAGLPDFDTPTDWAQWDDLIGNFDWQQYEMPGMHNLNFVTPQW